MDGLKFSYHLRNKTNSRYCSSVAIQKNEEPGERSVCNIKQNYKFPKKLALQRRYSFLVEKLHIWFGYPPIKLGSLLKTNTPPIMLRSNREPMGERSITPPTNQKSGWIYAITWFSPHPQGWPPMWQRFQPPQH